MSDRRTINKKTDLPRNSLVHTWQLRKMMPNLEGYSPHAKAIEKSRDN